MCNASTYQSLSNNLNHKTKYNVRLKCIDHGSQLTEGSYSEVNTLKDSTKISNNITVNINYINISHIYLINEDGTLKENETGHNHGGYKVVLNFTQKIADKSKLYIRVNEFIIKPINHSELEDTIMFIMPPINETISSFNLSISEDEGQTFTIPINRSLSGICSDNHYCPDYRILNVSRGHYCPLKVNKTSHIYCIKQRKCPPGTYTDHDNNIFTCEKVPRGYYLNFWGADLLYIQPKKCPRGFVCTEEGLPKYYEVCPPG